MKKVIIIGGGFTGSNVAKRLEKKFEVTLIDTKSYFEFTPSILKTITDPKLFEKIKVFHNDFLKNSKVIVGKVKKISKNSVFLGKKQIFFDYLVLASGSNYSSPIKTKNMSSVSKLKNLEKIHEKLGKAKKIVVVGGGLVGVELASELVNFYPEKKIEIFTSSKLLPRNNKKSREIAKNFLEKRNVKLNFNWNVNYKGRDYFFNHKKIKGDYFFLCTGIKSNSEFIKKEMKEILNKKGQFLVNKFLQVKGFNNIFSGGDVSATIEEKTAQSAVIHAKIISKNIVNLEKSKNLIPYFSKSRPMVISLGRKKGIFEYKSFSFFGTIPAIFKKLIEKKEIFGLGGF
ncbi:MAG: FAD-dependent oxidoreductase [Nanoarchaeota archaeon]|nr:FAD-dependent oxidoreductase [Nanoarchaeota archaeon]